MGKKKQETSLTVPERGKVPSVPMGPQDITEIAGISEVLRLQRGGFLRLGKEMLGRDYPEAIDYFRPDISDERLAKEFERKYGKQPREIPVVFPHPDRRVVAPQAYRMYRGPKEKDKKKKTRGVLVCKGDGLHYTRRKGIEREWDVGKCPTPERCEFSKGGCSRSMFLSVLPYELPTWLVLQINTTSFHSMVAVNTALKMLESGKGHIDYIPVLLRLVPKDITYPSGGMVKTRVGWILQVDIDVPLPEMLARPELSVAREIEIEPVLEEENPAEDLWPPSVTDEPHARGEEGSSTREPGASSPSPAGSDEDVLAGFVEEDDEVAGLMERSGAPLGKLKALARAATSVDEFKLVLSSLVKVEERKKEKAPKPEPKKPEPDESGDFLF